MLSPIFLSINEGLNVVKLIILDIPPHSAIIPSEDGMVITMDRNIEMIEDLDERVKNIESNIRIISNEIRNLTKKINKIEKLLIAEEHGISPLMEAKFNEWIKENRKEIGDQEGVFLGNHHRPIRRQAGGVGEQHGWDGY
jgi:hypothetical protein